MVRCLNYLKRSFEILQGSWGASAKNRARHSDVRWGVHLMAFALEMLFQLP